MGDNYSFCFHIQHLNDTSTLGMLVLGQEVNVQIEKQLKFALIVSPTRYEHPLGVIHALGDEAEAT